MWFILDWIKHTDGQPAADRMTSCCLSSSYYYCPHYHTHTHKLCVHVHVLSIYHPQHKGVEDVTPFTPKNNMCVHSDKKNDGNMECNPTRHVDRFNLR